MKKNTFKFFFIISCFFAFNMNAQVTFTGLKKDYTQSMDSLLTYVDKTPVTTGILYDRIMSFSDLDALKENGAITKSNYEHFIQGWSELYNSAYTPAFSSVENLKTGINNNTNSSLVDIGVINTKINLIDYGTTTAPKLNFANGYFSNVSGINPFLEKQVTVIAVLKQKVLSETITFRLQSAFMLQLIGLKIKTLQANFGDGTQYNLIVNQIVSTTTPSINYTTSGTKQIVFTVTYEDNTVEVLNSSIEVLPYDYGSSARIAAVFDPIDDFVGSNGIVAGSPENTIPFMGYNDTVATKGILEYRTYYNTVTNTEGMVAKINKPVIILDGYDPGDVRKIYDRSIGYDSSKSSLYELMAFNNDGNPDNFIEKLRPLGFDVTLVNFPNGADYVERNAMALVALLKRENQKLAANGSTGNITIIGPSMGGLVSRYALAYMEKNNISHNTRLWVSFDSPHLGANIPIGAQENIYFFGYTGKQELAKVKFDENFRSPAARQKLIEQLDGKHEAFPYPSSLWGGGSVGQNNSSPFRQIFQNNLETNGLSGSNGFPQNLRKIAVINGTANGTKTHTEGQMFLEMAAFKRVFGIKLKVATIEDRFLSTPNTWSKTFAGRTTLKGFAYVSVINSSINRLNTNPRGSMDNVQGGTFNTADVIEEAFTPGLEDEASFHEWRTNLHIHDFIPSVSALAFKNPNFDWSSAINRNLVCDPINKEIPFDTYFVPSSNEDHVKVTTQNANWLLKEIQGQPHVPSFPVEVSQLTGAPSVCLNVNSTYQFSDICKVPSAVTWKVSPNIQIVSSNSYSLIVKGTSNGTGTITATFQNGLTVIKYIWVGNPMFQINYDPNGLLIDLTVSPAYNSDPLEAQGVNFNTINWSILSQDGGSANLTGNGIYGTIQFSNSNSSAIINVAVTNNCGTENYSLVLGTGYDDSRIGNLEPLISQISNDNYEIINLSTTTANKLKITVFDIYGKIAFKSNSNQINLSNIEAGIYIIKAVVNDKVLTQKIIKE